MPSLIPQLITSLKADAGVSDLVGSRVYGDFAPNDVLQPCVIVYITSEDSEDCLDGMVNFDSARVRVEASGTTRESADDVSQACRVAFNNLLSTSYSGTTIQAISQATGKIQLLDRPNDGTDHWQFRTVQSFEISYHSF